MRSSWRLMMSLHRAVMGQRIRFESLLLLHQKMIPPGKGIKTKPLNRFAALYHNNLSNDH